MRNKPIKNFLSIAAVLVVCATLPASTPKSKTFRTQQDYESGEVKGVSINYNGEVSLAPRIDELHASSLPFLWASAVDSKGNVYAAGGNSGEVYKIDRNGNATKVFEVPEVHVYCLAVDKGNLYVGSSPQGKVYKVPFGKKVNASEAVFFVPEEVYIWSLVLDAQGNLFVATGEKGNIYKVSKNGEGQLFYASDEAHVRKIVMTQAGDLIAGTANNGLLLRISPQGKAFVLYDSPLVEITALLVSAEGFVYAAATGEQKTLRAAPAPSRTAQKNAESGDKGRGQGDEDDVLELHLQPLSAGGGSKQFGEVYQIAPDGVVRTYQTLKSERIYSMERAGAGSILLGTGDKGRLYKMNSRGEMTLLSAVDEMQITALQRNSENNVYIITSNPGKVYLLSAGKNKNGHFISQVIDAGVTSHWGAISWETNKAGSSGVSAVTRSGNTDKPDKTWSDWSQSYTMSAGQAIKSATARYLQVKVNLTSSNGEDSPVLREMSFSYLQRNVPPQIKQVRIHPPGEYYPESASKTKSNSLMGNGSEEGQNGFQSQSSLSRKSNKKGYRSVSWVVHDDNGDELSYFVFFRGEYDKNWRTLAEDLTGSVYSWDSRLMPDGRYFVRLEARDDLSNPPAMVLAVERVSEPFVVDNTGPAVSGIKVSQRGDATVISLTVEDAMTKLKSVEYGVNAAEWELVYPVDGICDTRLERFEITISPRLSGENSIVIKALDANGNIGFGTHNFKL